MSGGGDSVSYRLMCSGYAKSGGHLGAKVAVWRRGGDAGEGGTLREKWANRRALLCELRRGIPCVACARWYSQECGIWGIDGGMRYVGSDVVVLWVIVV